MTGAKGTADTMEDGEGRQYHIGLAPGELAEIVLLCGDPARSKRTSGLFDEVELDRSSREYVTFTGTYKGKRLSVMSTGIGPDNTEIAVIEASRITEKATFIRIGSCGGLQPFTGIGDLVVSTAAVRLENASLAFVREGYPAVASHDVVSALVEACESKGYAHHVGITATAPGFYGYQGRHMDDFPSRMDGLAEELAACSVLNMEMEASCLFTLASIRGLRAGAVCAVYANRHGNVPITKEQKVEAEGRCIDVGLEAALKL